MKGLCMRKLNNKYTLERVNFYEVFPVNVIVSNAHG